MDEKTGKKPYVPPRVIQYKAEDVSRFWKDIKESLGDELRAQQGWSKVAPHYTAVV
jgi:hypothetical protein